MDLDHLAKGSAESPGAATIVNAMATGRGAAFAIDLKVTATVWINGLGNVRGRIVGEPGGNTGLMEICVDKMLKNVDEKYGAVVETRSNLPGARGLSSSSACSNAIVLATASALQKLGHEFPSDEILIDLGIDASIEAGVTITGAFDDASASYFGGVVVTDNMARKILRKESMPGLEVVVLVPEGKSYSGQADVATMKLLGHQVEIAHREALEGDILKAMTLNGIIYCASIGYDPTPALRALEAGALAAGLSGKGPAFVALAEDGNRISKVWQDLGGTVLMTKTDNQGSRVIE